MSTTIEVTELDCEVERAQTAYLDRIAPGSARTPDAGHVPWFDNLNTVIEAINAALAV